MVEKIKLSWATYQDMVNRIMAFRNNPENMRYPKYVSITYNGVGYRVYEKDYKDAIARVKSFIASQRPPRNPLYVTVTAVKIETIRVVGPIQEGCEKLLGEFNSLTGFLNKCRGRGYGYYYGDVRTLAEESTTIKNLNCTDGSQLLVHLGKEMGYECHYVHIKCLVSGGGHVIAKIKGKEFSNYTYIDLAAMLSTTTMATIGKGWCFDAIPVNGVVDPPWLLKPDDGIT